jgi:hypothetical protein
MTLSTSDATCVLCSHPATEAVEPSRRTLARGADPSDDSFSVTVILPDVPLCGEHARAIREGDRLVGWCDDERCRTYGELGEPSPCGEPYAKPGSTRRA